VSRLAETTVPDEVLAQACAGVAAAHAAIYAALAPGTLTLIRRIVGEHAQAEDIFQDTMIILYERLPQFRGEAPLGAWLRQIAIRCCLMHLRSPWARARRCFQSLDPNGPTEQQLATPGFRAEALDVERALSVLPATARAVLWMYEVEGFSHQEIAREFGRSVSFSKSQLSRAHARLRAWFEPQEERPSCTLI
jgi:RNA polymerase sigma factor (sigma-70 family)